MDSDARTMTAALQGPRVPPTRYVEVVSPGKPAVYRARDGVVRLGRDAGNEVVLDDPFVSRVHLELRVFPHGVELRDLDTKNGTHYQGARIRELPVAVGAEVELLLGKQIRVKVRVGDDALDAQPVAPEAPAPRPSPVLSAPRPSRDTAELIGDGPAMRRLRLMVSRLAPSDLTVLVEGETGTGKEVIARALHAASRRARGPLVVFDCAAVSPSLLASELFGHVKGAFTGAVAAHEGAFRRADGGTLFLDELGELPLDLQPSLLRALEARQVRPVGATDYKRVDVRVVAATNRDLDAEVAAGRFRQDLLFRLAVGRVRVPPLRERREDIAALAQHFAAQLGAALHPDLCAQLQGRAWPGNVRELRNVVERAVMLSEHRLVTSLDDDLGPVPAPAARDTQTGELPAAFAPGPLSASPDVGVPFQDAKQKAVDAFERAYLLRLFEDAGYNLSEAARRSGVDRRYLRELFKKHTIDLDALRAGKTPRGE
jgi:two-component system nitrogen regulation response regulator GlnG